MFALQLALCVLGVVMPANAVDVNLVYSPLSAQTYVITESSPTAAEPSPPVANVIAGSYGNFWSKDTARGLFSFGAANDIKQNYPNHYIKSAILTLDLQYASCKDASLQEYDPYIMPGVCAYQVAVAGGGTLVPADFWVPVQAYLGQVVPRRVKTAGAYSLDVTQALQDAVTGPGPDAGLAVRLHFGDELNALHIDDNLHMEYAFAPGNADLEVTLSPLYAAGSELKSESLTTQQLNEKLPWCSERQYRVVVEFATEPTISSGTPVSVELAWPDLLAACGVNERVNRESIEVVEYDCATLRPKVYDGQFQDVRKYIIPARTFYPPHVYSELAYEVVAWQLSGADSLLHAIYFDTVQDSAETAARAYPIIGAGEPLPCYHSYASLPFYAQFSLDDLNGDGLVDIIGGGLSESGYLGVLTNVGNAASPLFSELERIPTGSIFISRMFATKADNKQSEGLSDPTAWDWDSDGDVDLYTTFNRWYTPDEIYYENVGSAEYPQFSPVAMGPALPFGKASAPPAFADLDDDQIYEILSASGGNVTYRGSQVATYTTVVTRLGGYDIDGDGLKDLIIGLAGGKMEYCKNTGVVNGRAQLAPAQPVLAERGPVEVGNFSTPYAVDWDADGDLDILSGNEDGTVISFENIGTTAQPSFVDRGALSADGQVIHFPGEPVYEPLWGYTSLSAIDWDNDHDFDLLISQRTGQINFYENIGSPTNAELTFVDALRFTSNNIILPNPRVKPAFFDWDNDDRHDLIMGTTGGQAAIYYNAGQTGGLVFQQPTVLLDPQSDPIYTERYQGQGRSRYVRVDWNDDDLMDLMIFNHVADAWPRYYENIGSAAAPLFEEKQQPKVKDHHLWVGIGHAPCAMAVDWDNDGLEDIILGGEDGLIRYYNRKFFLPPPPVRRMFYTSRYGLRSIYDCRRFADVDRYVGQQTLFGDDLIRASGAGAWNWNPLVVAHHSDLLSIANPTGYEALVYDPHLAGVYSVSVGIKPQNTEDVSIHIRLDGAPEWDLLETTILEDYQVSGDVTLYRYQVVPWGDFDLTGRKVEIQPVANVDVQLDFIKFVPTSRVGAVARNPLSSQSDASWWDSVYYDGTSTAVRPHDQLVVVGSFGQLWGSRVYRGIYTFDLPAVIRNTYPDYNIDSARLILDLDYAYCKDSSLNPYDEFDMPGVRVRQIELIDHSVPNNVQADDFWAPVLSDIGWMVPPGGTLQNGYLYFDGSIAAGEYSIDIADALRHALSDAEQEIFAVRLHFGAETDAAVVDEGLYIEYVFEDAPVGPRMELTLAPRETRPLNCSDVKEYLHSSTADLNYDCRVDITDLKMFSEQWLVTSASPQENIDFNCDCRVDLVDFARFALQWLFCNDPDSTQAGGACVTNW